MTRWLSYILPIGLCLAACEEKRSANPQPPVNLAAQRELERTRKELDDERHKNDLLRSYVAEATKTINDVNDRLGAIAPLAGSISSRARDPELRGSFTAEQRNAVLQQISAMEQKLKQSKLEIEQFKQRQSGFREQIAELSATIDRLHRSVEEKSSEIAGLRETIQGMRVEVERLRSAQQQSHQEITQKDEALAERERQVNALGDALNTALVAIGSVKQLLAQHIVVEVGVFRKSRRMAPKLDPTKFKPVDIRTTPEFVFAVPKSRVEVISTHPDGSFHLENRTGGGSALVIDEAQTFWKFRCLVVGMM
jgi:archaellum component FlaC